MKTKLALSIDATRALFLATLFLLSVASCKIFVLSARAGDDTLFAPPPVRYVEDFTNATTSKINAAKTWAVYPSAEIYVPAATSVKNAAIVTNGTPAGPGQPVTAPPNPAAQAPTAPADAATPPPPDPDNVPNNFQAAPTLQGAR